jgi:hypothetical protein
MDDIQNDRRKNEQRNEHTGRIDASPEYEHSKRQITLEDRGEAMSGGDSERDGHEGANRDKDIPPTVGN